MINKHRQALIKIYPFLDLLIMVCTFFAAALAVAHAESGIHFLEFFSMRIKVQNFVLLAGILFLWHVVFSAFGLYDSRRLSSFRVEFFDILKATTVGTVIVSSLSFLFHIKMADNTFLSLFWVACTLLTLSSRFLLRYTLRHFRVHGRNLRNILIVGTNERAIRIARKIEAKPELGYRVLGFVDDDWSGTSGFLRTGFRQVSSLDQFPDFLRKQVVDEVLLCLPMSSYYPHASAIVGQCEEQGIIVRFLSDLFNLKQAKSKADQFEGEYLLTLIYRDDRRLAGDREADHRFRAVPRNDPSPFPSVPYRRPVDQGDFPRPRLLPAGEAGPLQTEIPYLQIPDDGSRCGSKTGCTGVSERGGWRRV